MCCVSCGGIQIHDQLVVCLDKHKESSKNTYSDCLKEHVKSSTDEVCKRVEEQRQELYNAVAELSGRLQVLRQCLLEAGDLEYVTAV